MPITVTVDATGSTPVFVYICDDPITSCVYIDSVSTFPYTFNIPAPIDDLLSYNVKIIDSNGCEKTQIIVV